MERKITFGSNLKYYREKQGLTQRQLAEQLGYTEKSISKWENENGLPTLEMVLRLTELLQVPLDELVFEKNTKPYFLGIDGGGTKTVFKLTDESGTVLNTVCKESSNPNDVGMERATSLLKEGIHQVCQGIPYAKVSMFAGISGGGLTGNNAKVLSDFFREFGFLIYDNGSDLENLVALADHEKCILIIMGTGFIVYALNGSERKRIAGWGQFFDDGGSGYTLGRDVITAVLRAGDDSGEKTVLTSLLEERIGETAEAHVAAFYEGGKRYIAGFADLVFTAAEKGDPVAVGILEKNMAFVAKMIDTAVESLVGSEQLSGNVPVLFSGGISAKQDVLFPLIMDALKNKNCTLERLEQEPVEGSLRRAKQLFDAKVSGGK